ncbi:hypothetical protein DFS34DRAFT_574144 [Phlyctochytrium arcticum]|nr:hypothetical protein DFS34DRAFT_574144 [Phlyctochytrium arcticum]
MTTASAQDLAFWASEFQTLRQKKGHFSGGEHDTDVDSYKGKKHTIMESLGKALGVKGNPAVKVLESMGQPDEIAAGPGAITGGMPGPVITGGAPPLTETIPGKNYFLIYYWRGRHDYLWFEVNASDETVEACDWYQAGE